MLKSLQETMHFFRTTEVLPFFSTTESPPLPEIAGIAFSRPCELGILHPDGRFQVLRTPVWYSFARNRWVEDQVSQKSVTIQASHWRVLP